MTLSSMIDASSIPIGELVPHGPRIRVIDKLESHAPDRSVASGEVRADNAFLAGSGVPGWAGIEYMAQAAAAHAGAAARIAGAPPTVGYLVGTREYRCAVAEFALGSRLTITVRPLWSERGAAAFDCAIDVDGVLGVAAAVINVYVPSAAERPGAGQA